MSSDRAIGVITTTINVPVNLLDWAGQLSAERGDFIIIAGDLKTPHDDVKALAEQITRVHVPCVYLAPDDQGDWTSSAVIGWNTIQRRNIALLEAMTRRPEIIMTLDDDNFPVRDSHITQVRECLTGVAGEQYVVKSSDGWFNAASITRPPVVHRGYPLARRWRYGNVSYSASDVAVGVLASLWLGDPDIDATERIGANPAVTGLLRNRITLAPGTWCPFNSQSTAYRIELAPSMAVWSGVGRFDDIWASYVARRIMDELAYVVTYGEPLVVQRRNDHDLFKDLRAEMYGYEHTEALTEALRGVRLDHDVTVTDMVATCYRAARLPFVSDDTLRANDAWITDLYRLEG